VTGAPHADRSGAAGPDQAAARVARLFDRHGRMVYGICRALLRDLDEAEDAAQQVFLSAHAALLGGVEVRDAARWLATIARNECRRRIVAGMRAPLPVSDADLELVPAVRDEQATRQQALELRAAFAALPDRQREAAVLRYLYGLRYGEVAAALGLSRPAADALLFRARRALRRRLSTLAGAGLVLPPSLREELALAIPGFPTAAGPSAMAVGAAGGVLAKLAAAPSGAKVAATAAAAVSSVGTVGTIQSDRPARETAPPRVAPQLREPAAASRVFTAPSQKERDSERDRSGPGRGGDGEDRRSGHGGPAGRGSSNSGEELGASGGPGPKSGHSDVIDTSASSGSSGPSDSSGSEGSSDSYGHGSSDGGGGSGSPGESSSGEGSGHGGG